MRLKTIYEPVHKTDTGYKWIKLDTGKRIGFYDAEKRSEYAISTLVRWMSRMFKLVGDHEHSQYDLEAIDRLCYRLETLIGHWRYELDKRHVKKSKQERIKLLRNTRGRTAEEAALYQAKADSLEKELQSKP